MSKEQALKFIEQANSDSALQQKIAAIPDEAIGEFVKLGAQAGYQFSGEDFQAAMLTFDQDLRSTSAGSDDTLILKGRRQSGSPADPE
jgi:predicted ribosomally synthesized peptide with nif11-like leader